MNSTGSSSKPDDLLEAVRQDRPLDTTHGFRVRIADKDLNFKTVVLNDPLPLGRQLAEAAGARVAEDYSVAAILKNGDIETIRPDEPYDLRGRGAEQVIVVPSATSYRFMIDNADLEWPLGVITGAVVKALAKLPAGYDLYQEVRGGQGHDRLIEDCTLINLDDPGLERFISIEAETVEGLAKLPSKDETYLHDQGLTFEVVQTGRGMGVILKDFLLPEGVFDQANADVMILLPNGYPDACPDMFYVSPWIKVVHTGQYARAANVSFQFGGRDWQRWSRHNQAWRPGIDGLHTMIARARTAFQKCAA
ncbi:MAG: multiubiquitin domain-containing protein [Henriciella sp.]|nr:multiubiquitin domain-containing protein [Henriciella sp.]